MESSSGRKKVPSVQYGKRARRAQVHSPPALAEVKVDDIAEAKVTPASPVRASRSRRQSASPQKGPVTPNPFISPAASNSALPLRPDRRGSPSLRSISISPQKLGDRGSLSPTKSIPRSRTPTRPAKDLDSLFDVIGSEPGSPFSRSVSQPTVRLGDASPYPEAPQSPSLAYSELPFSPTKRARLTERMAPRIARPSSPSIMSPFSRHGTFHKTATEPQIILTSPEDKAIEADSINIVEPAENADVVKRRYAGIKQVTAANAKRTYGLQRSFLADQAEDTLLADPSTSTPAENIEDTIEAQLSSDMGPERTRQNGRAIATQKVSRSNPSAPLRESYADLLRKWGEGADEIEWDESQDPTLNLKSITSLRSVGELRRFNDDLEYLFSGLAPSQPRAVRQSSAFEFVRLLCGQSEDHTEAEELSSETQSAQFLRKLKATDNIVRAFDLLKASGNGVDRTRNHSDHVLDVALGICLATLLRTAGSAEPLLRERWSELYMSLGALLHGNDGLAKLNQESAKVSEALSRTERESLTKLQALAKASRLFIAGSNRFTLRILLLGAVCSLAALPRRLLTHTVIRDLVSEGSEPASLLTRAIATIKTEGEHCQASLANFSKGFELFADKADKNDSADLDSIDLCIRFLDKCMDMLYIDLQQGLAAEPDLFERLNSIVFYCIQVSHFEASSVLKKANAEDIAAATSDNLSDRSLQVIHGLLKLLLDLSQVDTNWSLMQATSARLQQALLRALFLSHQCATELRRHAPSKLTDAPSSDPGDRSLGDSESQWKLALALRQDVVHLSLAVLTNLLIKQSDTARDTLSSITLNASCWRKRSCAQMCTCIDSETSIRLLARLFLKIRTAAMDHGDSEAAYFSSSVATALAQFAVGGAKYLATCREALNAQAVDGGGAHTDGFGLFIEAVEEFAVLHEAAFTQVASIPLDGSSDVVEAPTEEAGRMIKDLAKTLRSMAAQ